MIKYPNLKKVNATNNAPTTAVKNNRKAHLGLTLEADIKATNQYYLTNNIAVIYKKPTPVQLVKVLYPARNKAKITEAYFKEPSTTDYNGLYQGLYIDFDVKETCSKTSFPLNNIAPHQIRHLARVYEHGGVSFLIINFKAYQEYYFCPYNILKVYFDNINNKKSIPYRDFKQVFLAIPFTYQPRLDYLKVIKDNLVKIIKPLDSSGE